MGLNRTTRVEFWRNHFNIDQTKDNCVFFANHYEENVIRKHAFGRFEQLLVASASHPAMLIYLDNDVSQKPLTKEENKELEFIRQRRLASPNAQLSMYARGLERQTGLNENYARELMELRTGQRGQGLRQVDRPQPDESLPEARPARPH